MEGLQWVCIEVGPFMTNCYLVWDPQSLEAVVVDPGEASARILDEISVQKPDKIQLEALKKEGAKLGIEGIALDDETVANFMTNLRKSRLFKNIDLIVSEQSEQSRIKLKKFTLSCEISFI